MKTYKFELSNPTEVIEIVAATFAQAKVLLRSQVATERLV